MVSVFENLQFESCFQKFEYVNFQTAKSLLLCKWMTQFQFLVENGVV